MVDYTNKAVNEKFPHRRQKMHPDGVRYLYLRKKLAQAQSRRLRMLPSQDIQRDPADALGRRLNRRQLMLLNKLLYYTQRYDTTYCRQQRLADETGYSKIQVHRLLKQFEKMGLVGRVYRGVRRTCLYYASPFFDLPWVQHQLRSIVRCFLTLALGMLYSISPLNGHDNQGYLHGCNLKTQRDSQYQPASTEPSSMASRDCHLPSSLSTQAGVPASGSEHGTRAFQKRGSMETTVGVMQPAVQHLCKKGHEDLSRGIPLTPQGCMKLNVFPVTVHRKVYQEYTKKWDQLRHPFTWYFKRCIELCDTLGEKPAWNQMYEQFHALGLSVTDGKEVDEHTLQRLQRQQAKGIPAQWEEESLQKQIQAARNSSAQDGTRKPSQPAQFSTQQERKPPYTTPADRDAYVRRSNEKKQQSKRSSKPMHERIGEGLENIDRLRKTNPAMAQQLMACLPQELYDQMQQYWQSRIDEEET